MPIFKREYKGCQETSKAGFTLIEMMVAVFVVSIMISIIAPHLMGAGKRAEETANNQNERTIQSALQEYYLIHHEMPVGNSTEILSALVQDQILDSVPQSPSGGNYVINDTDVNNVTVSLDGN